MTLHKITYKVILPVCILGAGWAAIQIFALLIAFSEPIVLFGIKIINSLCRFGGALNGV